ncbi:MAG: hypothetical protein ED559_12585 [Phycisphaera sp.]|nr:MAG: hypothetical protein ED559_12585 [Phycisphaera sp.]
MKTQLLLTGVSVLCAGVGSAQVYDFGTLVHGEVVANQFAPDLVVSGTNPNRAFDIIAAFDTTEMNTSDPDLQGPPWSGGNLAVSATEVVIGNALIIAENNTDANNDGVLDDPDDEISRPSGTIDLSFATSVPVFGLDIIDIEGVVEEESSLDFYSNGNIVGTVNFTAFTDNVSAYFDPSVQFGNNHANRIQPIPAADFGVLGFDRVVINVGGSSAYDTFVVPSPSSAVLLSAGLLLGIRKRR